jgi:hypothetical protein
MSRKQQGLLGMPGIRTGDDFRFKSFGVPVDPAVISGNLKNLVRWAGAVWIV